MGLHMDRCHLKSGKARVCNAWPLGEGNTEEAPQVPAVENSAPSWKQGQPSQPCLILKCSGFSPRPTMVPHQHIRAWCRQVSAVLLYIYMYMHSYIYTPDTSKLRVWDILYLTSSNVLSHTITKNTLKLFRTEAEGKANAKDKERQRKQSGCVWCQDCWQEAAFFLSHMLVLLLLVLFHDQRTLQESQLDRYSMSVAGNRRK